MPRRGIARGGQGGECAVHQLIERQRGERSVHRLGERLRLVAQRTGRSDPVQHARLHRGESELVDGGVVGPQRVGHRARALDREQPRHGRIGALHVIVHPRIESGRIVAAGPGVQRIGERRRRGGQRRRAGAEQD
jgi:hypothetical protein